MSDVQKAELMARRIRALSEGGYRFGQDRVGTADVGHARGLLLTGAIGVGLVLIVAMARRKKGR